MQHGTIIYFARHGETEWNLEWRYQGHGDSPLTPRGLAQAEQLAQELAAERLDAVFASDLGRAVRTAQAIAAPHGLEVRTHPGLREIDTGAWSGLERSQVAAGWPQEFETWRAHPHTIRVPGGETLAEVQARALAALWELVEPLRGGRVAVIAHGAMLETVLAHALGLELNALWLRLMHHCQVYTLEYADGQLRLLKSE
ncbi:MAG: histidine phosphatase family protein [Chloroflexi bacterium]|nr:histidine phosphatase family protein [Chloroflexota bacterium]